MMPKRSAAHKPPSKAQREGNHPCSIQVIAEHMMAVPSSTPNHALFASTMPRAGKRNCAGGYIE